jgi:hypothetical protein
MSKSFASRRDPVAWAGRSRTTARRSATVGLALLALGCAGVARAQVVPGEAEGIGSLAADRARLRQITGRPVDPATAGPDSAAARYIRTIPPTTRFSWNSDLPNSGNDAELWAGRGANVSVTGGVGYAVRWADRTIDIRVAPTVAYSQNRPFFVFPGRGPGRSAFSSPWHAGQASADLPLRFGDIPVRGIGLGQSAVTVTAGAVAYGAAATSEWWGPSIRNTLLFGNNAAGVPRLFVRTARPVHTRYGDFQGRAFVGALTESPFLDVDPSNDMRALSALLVTFRPALDTGLTLGLSRLVMASARSTPGVLRHAFDVVLRYEPLRTAGDTTGSGVGSQGTDQLFSVFGRWVFPASGFEAYGEWAWMELPRSARELLVTPQSTLGYTLGAQWAQAHRAAGFLRLQGEATYLEQTTVIPNRPPPSFYTGRATVQGFTQRGQVLGAPIGPGSSTQFLGADWIAGRWQAGAFAGRTRTENDALYQTADPRLVRHDVTVFSGVRAGARLPWYDVSSELTVGRRYNYLFQSDFYLGEPVVATDVQNVTFTMVISPR